MDALQIASAAEIPVIAALVAALTQLVKQTKIPNEYLPLVAVAIGIVAGLLAAVITGDTNYLQSATQGFLTAATTAWGVSAIKPAVAAVSANTKAKQAAQEAAMQDAIDKAVAERLATTTTTTEVPHEV